MTLHTQGLQTLAQVQAFASNNEAVAFMLKDRIAAYGWMTDTLKQFHYGRCQRADKGELKQYLRKGDCSHLRRARCIKQFNDDAKRTAHETLSIAMFCDYAAIPNSGR